MDLVGGISRSEFTKLRINPQNKDSICLNESLPNLFSKWKDHILNKKPVQYIAGFTYWRDLKLKVSSDVLIPRVETEQIVDIVKDIFSNNEHQILFTDLGTGSGALAVSISKSYPSWMGLATDVDRNAILLAQINKDKYCMKSNLEFYCGSWWDPLTKFAGHIDLAISNPPYIPSEVYESLPFSVKNFEPKISLLGGLNGLMHLKKIIEDAPKFLKKGGWLIFENHYDQGPKIRKLLIEYGFDSIKTILDIHGIGRFTIGRYK